jgi:hypothetical protein
MRRWLSNIRSRQQRLRPRRARKNAQSHNQSSGKQSHHRHEPRPRRRKLGKSFLERARMVDKYLAQKDQGFAPHAPQSQHAGARWKRLPVRVSDTRCPPTMPFPGDPSKDSRFIGRAGMELVHAKDGNSNATDAEPATVGRYIHADRERIGEPAEAFLRRSVRTSNKAASARSSRLAVRTRQHTSASALPYSCSCWGCAHQSSKEHILASVPRDLSLPPTGTASIGVGHQDFQLDGKTWIPSPV